MCVCKHIVKRSIGKGSWRWNVVFMKVQHLLPIHDSTIEWPPPTKVSNAMQLSYTNNSYRIRSTFYACKHKSLIKLKILYNRLWWIKAIINNMADNLLDNAHFSPTLISSIFETNTHQGCPKHRHLDALQLSISHIVKVSFHPFQLENIPSTNTIIPKVKFCQWQTILEGGFKYSTWSYIMPLKKTKQFVLPLKMNYVRDTIINIDVK